MDVRAKKKVKCASCNLSVNAFRTCQACTKNAISFALLHLLLLQPRESPVASRANAAKRQSLSIDQTAGFCAVATLAAGYTQCGVNFHFHFSFSCSFARKERRYSIFYQNRIRASVDRPSRVYRKLPTARRNDLLPKKADNVRFQECANSIFF